MVMFSVIIDCKSYRTVHFKIIQSVYSVSFHTCPMVFMRSTQCWLLLATNQCCITVQKSEDLKCVHIDEQTVATRIMCPVWYSLHKWDLIYM